MAICDTKYQVVKERHLMVNLRSFKVVIRLIGLSILTANGIKKLKIKFSALEAQVFKKGVRLNFCIVIKIYCLQSNLDQTYSNCNNHEYCNLTEFGQYWTENKKNNHYGKF